MQRALESSIQSVRRFNRFYTRRIRIIQDQLSSTDFSLAEANVLFELYRGEQEKSERLSAKDLAVTLSLDAGYLSRVLKRLERRGLIERRRSETDRRATLLSLTESGRTEFEAVDRLAHDEVRQLLEPLGSSDRSRLVRAMGRIEEMLGDEASRDRIVVLREHRPGDMGWVTERNAVYYAEAHDFEVDFEAIVGEITSKFLRDFQPGKDRCWIAELGGERVGAVFCVHDSDNAGSVARLRLLLVEPRARGLGLGRRLVAECVDFARRAGYQKLVLWTRNVLAAARHLYEEAGFVLVEETPHESLPGMVEESWELVL